MTTESCYVVVDAESLGLHGPAFAVGAVALTASAVADYRAGRRAHPWVEEMRAACDPRPLLARCVVEDEDRAWLEAHVWPHLGDNLLPSDRAVREAFWSFWRRWAERGAWLVADCGWPVEAGLLSACVRDEWPARCYQGPYPMLDLATVLWATGVDPRLTFSREPDELPAHDPLRDARQTARLLCDYEALTWPTAATEGNA